MAGELLEFQPINESDAYLYGQYAVIGLAEINHPVLRRPARPIIPGEMSSEYVRGEVGRMLDAASDINDALHGNFSGLAHNQLRPAEGHEDEDPLQLILVPTDIPGVAKELTVGKFSIQCLGNTKFDFPQDPVRRRIGVLRSWEGCFSAANTSAERMRPGGIRNLSALDKDGASVTAHRIVGLPAISLQHETAHGRGERAADGVGRPRLAVSQDEIATIRKIRRSKRAEVWPRHISDRQWEEMSTSPDYDLYSTEVLRAAYERGRERQLQRRQG
jgi:hypothetical protein